MIRQIAPQFFTTEMAATLAYYKDKLGFDCVGTWDDPPVYAIVARDEHRIHFRLADPPNPIPTNTRTSSSMPDMLSAHYRVGRREEAMRSWRCCNSLLLLGFIVGLIFGAVNLVLTWLYPLADDTPGALLQFYGPMFLVWIVASFRTARRTGRLLSGVTAGLTVAFGTFLVFDLLILLRVNLFLNELTGRADWQNMMVRFRASDADSLRLFVNLDYVKGAPLKLGVSCAIGVVMGGIGGSMGVLTHRRTIAAA